MTKYILFAFLLFPVQAWAVTATISQALNILTPGAQWSLNGTTCTDTDQNPGLIWLDMIQSRPTCTQIAAVTLTNPSISGCSISSGTAILASPGVIMGSYVSGISGACTVTITVGNQVSAAHGWNATANDLTTQSDIITQALPYSTTSATLSGTTVSGDTITYILGGY